MADDQATLTRQVKEANDIVAVVGSYLPLSHAGPTTHKGLCPFHSDTRPSFQVDSRWQNFRCWACGKRGDVYLFVQEMEKVSFPEAREILARRAGIALNNPGAAAGRVRLLDAIRWAADRYQHCLLDSPLAEDARTYLGERKLTGETVRRFGLGFAPLAGDWLVRLAGQTAGLELSALVEVGLLGERTERAGFYDRFRERVMFPVRDAGGRVVGFGGRILPKSAYASRVSKYYNSSDTPLFHKSELLYGLDLARKAAADAGYLAVVEGYTDVMMAHQHGVGQVVATMGTALNARHVQQLRRFVPKVVLVFDADAGGMTGVDRALELFVSLDVELAIATLPDGLDPCDLLVEQGAEAFRKALAGAVDALDFKMNQVLAREEGAGVEGKRRVVDAALGVLALAPEMAGQGGQVKRELIVTRIAHRLGLREETVWARFGELKREQASRRQPEPPARSNGSTVADMESAEGRKAPAPLVERQLLQVLLAEPGLVGEASASIAADEVSHPGLRRMLEGLYDLHRQGQPADLDALRCRLNHPALAACALEFQEVGRMNPDRRTWLGQIVAAFREKHSAAEKQKLQSELTGVDDHAAAVELLRKLQNQSGAVTRDR